MMIFIKWLGSFVEGPGGFTSSKKLALVMAATAYSLGIASLMFAKAYWVFKNGGDCSLEIIAGSFPLCALAGVAYTMGKPTERTQ